MNPRMDIASAIERPTRALAEFAAETQYEDLPQPVIHESKRMILDILGCALGGSVTDIGQVAIDLARYLGGNPQATVIGSGGRVSCVNAGHANARMGNALDADDTLLSISHHGNLTVCSALATGEAQRISGKGLITAVAIGFDVGARLSISIGPPTFGQKASDDEGQKATVPSATFAAASAAAKALNLDTEQMTNALGIAGMENCVASSSHWQKPLLHTNKSGLATETGITIALLAQRGLTADHEVLQGKFGLWKLTGAKACNFELMVGELGERWYLLDTTYKPWPSCRFTHHPLTALTKLLSEHRFNAKEIERVVVRAHPAGNQPRLKNQNPDGVVNFEFSIPHVVAMMLLGVAPGPTWYRPDTMNDTAVCELRRKVVVELQPDSAQVAMASNTAGQLRKLPASVKVVCGGNSYSAYTEYAKGDPWSQETYFTDEDIKDKFRNMAAPLAIASESWHGRIEEIIDTVFGLEQVKDINTLSRLLSP